ncbi:hypothetical protein K440DRAFT_258918 [Wilcoxina mikolae CBS 423.85]|nr:hypothetical protein K440DRAFT_258918 [Wilcoxina mikolae CBS 423.85]
MFLNHLLYLDHPHCHKRVDAGPLLRSLTTTHFFSTNFFRRRCGNANHPNRRPRILILYGQGWLWIGRGIEIGTAGRRRRFACESVRDDAARYVAVYLTRIRRVNIGVLHGIFTWDSGSHSVKPSIDCPGWRGNT